MLSFASVLCVVLCVVLCAVLGAVTCYLLNPVSYLVSGWERVWQADKAKVRE